MGRLLVGLFSRGYRITVISRDPGGARKTYAKTRIKVGTLQDACRAEVVVLAVPIMRAAEVAGAIAPSLRPGSLLVDIASVKTRVADRIAQVVPEGVEYLSLHPLFGPGIRSFRGENIVAIHLRNGGRSEEMVDYLAACGLEVRTSDIQSHDRMMSRLQVLHHFAYLCLCTALFRDGEMPSLRDFSTHSLRVTWKHLASYASNLESILEIQKFNPYAGEARRAFSEEVARRLPMGDASIQGIRKAMELVLRDQ